jgi:hypothetical protein
MHSDASSDLCIMMEGCCVCGNVSVSDNCDQCMQQDPVTDGIP